jgi:hypothetical protein
VQLSDNRISLRFFFPLLLNQLCASCRLITLASFEEAGQGLYWIADNQHFNISWIGLLV